MEGGEIQELSLGLSSREPAFQSQPLSGRAYIAPIRDRMMCLTVVDP